MTAPTPTPNAMPGATPAPAEPAIAEGQQQQAAVTAPPVVEPPKAPEAPKAPDAPKPPWEASGEDFDPQRAWNLIQNLRGDLDKAKPVLDEHERLRQASQTDLERAKEELTAATGQIETWRTQAIRAQAEQLATGKFVSTKAAVAMIGDLSEFGTPEGIDIPKLQARLDQLAAEEPNLVAPQGPPGFTPNRGQGQSGTGQIPLDAQIKAAQERGDFATSIALQQQKLIKK